MELYRRRGSKLWWLTYSIQGRRFRESTGTASKRQAEALMAKRETELFEGRNVPDKKKTGLTVAGLRDAWLEHAKQKRSIRDDRRRFNAIIDFFGANCFVAQLSKSDIERFRDALADRDTLRKGKMAPATVNRHLALLRSALRNVKGEYLHGDPMHGVKFMTERNQRERECEPEEYEQLLEHAAPDLRLAIVLAREAGLRRTEICRALRKHVNLRMRELHIPASDSKNDFPRSVPLTRRALEEIASAPARLDGRLLGLEPDELSQRFRKLCSKQQIKGMTFHDLRGTAITRLARQGASLAELQKFSGHRSVQALMRYLKRGDRRLRELVDAMEANQGA